MRDKKKYFIPKLTKYPLVGDINIKLFGKTASVPFKVFKKIKNFFKTDSVVGESLTIPGDIEVYIKELNKNITFSPKNYLKIKNNIEFVGIVGNKKVGSEGDILVHNDDLNLDAILSFSDWLEVDDSWNLEGIQGINTYEEEGAENGDYIIMANGHTLIIKPADYSKLSDHWEHVDTIVIPQLAETNE